MFIWTFECIQYMSVIYDINIYPTYGSFWREIWNESIIERCPLYGSLNNKYINVIIFTRLRSVHSVKPVWSPSRAGHAQNLSSHSRKQTYQVRHWTLQFLLRRELTFLISWSEKMFECQSRDYIRYTMVDLSNILKASPKAAVHIWSPTDHGHRS